MATPMSTLAILQAAGRCPVCADALGDQPVCVCRSCDMPAHSSCAEYVGGCSRYACPEAASPRTRVTRFLATRVSGRVALWSALVAACAFEVAYGVVIRVTIGGPVNFGILAQHALSLLIMLGCAMPAAIGLWDLRSLSTGTIRVTRLRLLLQRYALPDGQRPRTPQVDERNAQYLRRYGIVIFVISAAALASQILPLFPAALAGVLMGAAFYTSGRLMIRSAQLDQAAARLARLWASELAELTDPHPSNKAPVKLKMP